MYHEITRDPPKITRVTQRGVVVVFDEKASRVIYSQYLLSEYMGLGWVLFRPTTLQGSLEITKDPLVKN